MNDGFLGVLCLLAFVFVFWLFFLWTGSHVAQVGFKLDL